MLVENRTPFVLGRAVFLDRKAAEHLVIALKATLAIAPDGSLRVAEEQTPIVPGDEFHGEPDRSSMKQESELGPVKPATDVFLQGSAVAPRPGTRQMQVGLRFGPLAVYANVFGDRVWASNLGRPAATAPEPFETMPLFWELAFGGSDFTAEDASHHQNEPRNPVGRGFRAEKSRAAWVDAPLPNIEDPYHPLSSPGQRVPPVGFGPIGRNWEPRVRHAGTYDQGWLDRRAPLLPDDFDDRFHNAAPAALIARGHLSGAQPVEVTGCTPEGRLAFTIPSFTPQAAARVGSSLMAVPMPLNTVTVDTWRMQVRLLWKGELRVHGKLLQVSGIQCRVPEAA